MTANAHEALVEQCAKASAEANGFYWETCAQVYWRSDARRRGVMISSAIGHHSFGKFPSWLRRHSPAAWS